MIQKLKLDENLSHQLTPILRRSGYDVATVAEEGLLSQSDVVVAAAAKGEGRLRIFEI
jgi:predicted nuclease of predicted toxin-antitoxin system